MTHIAHRPVARWLQRGPSAIEPLHLAAVTGRHVVVPPARPVHRHHAEKGS